MNVPYNAMDIAKYIVTYCKRKNRPISNLKLQKILYFAWVDYYRENERALFNNAIQAWQFGPVIPEVYRLFSIFAGNPILREFEPVTEMREEDIAQLNETINKYIMVAASLLVNITHEKGKPWDLTYRNGMGKNDIISFDLIIEKECA